MIASPSTVVGSWLVARGSRTFSHITCPTALPAVTEEKGKKKTNGLRPPTPPSHNTLRRAGRKPVSGRRGRGCLWAPYCVVLADVLVRTEACACMCACRERHVLSPFELPEVVVRCRWS